MDYRGEPKTDNSDLGASSLKDTYFLPLHDISKKYFLMLIQRDSYSILIQQIDGRNLVAFIKRDTITTQSLALWEHLV